MTTLLTFLGQGPPGGYALANYRFECGFECETKFFAAAAIARMRDRREPLKRCIIIGTTTSHWHALADCITTLGPRECHDDARYWADTVRAAMHDKKTVEGSYLREFEAKYSSVLGIDLQLLAVDNDGDQIFAALDHILDRHSRVIADVTHGFRTIPINAVFALGALRWLKDIEIVDVIYGSYDRDNPTIKHPAYSLRTASRLARYTHTLAPLTLLSDVSQVAELFESKSPELAENLRETQRLESLMQYTSSAKPSADALAQLQALKHPTPFDTACADATITVLTGLRSETDSAAYIARSKSALARGDYFRALSLAREGLRLRIIESPSLGLSGRAEAGPPPGFRDSTKYAARLDGWANQALQQALRLKDAPEIREQSRSDSLDALNEARNAVSHVRAPKPDKPDPFESADSLRALLEWSFAVNDFLTESRCAALALAWPARTIPADRTA